MYVKSHPRESNRSCSDSGWSDLRIVRAGSQAAADGEGKTDLPGGGVLQVVDMGNTSIVGRGDFAIEDGVAAKREQFCERVAKLAEIEKRLKGKRPNDLSTRLRNNGSPLAK